jgi:F-type H+-transporting ATPase subunit b
VEKIIPLGVELYVNLVAFAVLFVLLWKFAFPPITKMLDQRAETIRESLEKSESTRVEAERLLDEYKVQMAEARLEAAKVIEQGRRVAETMKDEIVAKANVEAAAIVAKAREDIQAEKRAVMAELQASVADLSVAVAGKVIGAQLSAADHKKLIESYVAEVGSLNGN